MIDPLDPGTLPLNLPKVPKDNAQRQRELRQRRREERAAGQRATLDFNRGELALLGVALGEFSERWQRVPSKLKAVQALMPRIPAVSVAEAFPGDSAWLPDAAQQMGVYPNYVGNSSYTVDTIGHHAPLIYRQTPAGQPEVDALVAPGDQVWTSYGSGPYEVKCVTAREWRGMRCFSLALIDLADKREAWINEVVAVDGRLLRLFANVADEVFFAPQQKRAHASAATGPAPACGLESVLQALEDKLEGLQKALERERRECAMLEQERNNAFAAYKVLEDRLKAAGLSTDYR